MHAAPSHLDRLASKLRQLRLRQPHHASGRCDRLLLGAECLSAVIRGLAEEGLPREDLQPLLILAAELREQLPPAATIDRSDRPEPKPPTDAMLARVAASIDLLVKAGYDEERAAQLIMRKLLAAGVAPPPGGDARGWKRLLFWRADLSFGIASPEAKEEYRAFLRELETIPASERVKRVVGEQLWDRRRLQLATASLQL
jgi:hypothetical protein